MMEVIKIQLAKEEHDRMAKEHEIKLLREQEEMARMENESKNTEEIKFRENNLIVLHFNLNKISMIDKETFVLKELLEIPISKYTYLKSPDIELDTDVYDRLLKFLNSIRIKKEDKELLIKLFKKI